MNHKKISDIMRIKKMENYYEKMLLFNDSI